MNKTAIAFGTFDGVHRGHQEIINAMLSAAKRGGLDPLIYTFSNHPAGLFGKSFSMIMTDGERLAAPLRRKGWTGSSRRRSRRTSFGTWRKNTA